MADYREVSPEYLHCRSWGHNWQFTTVDRTTLEWVQGMKCLDCGTHRNVRIEVRTGLRQHGNRYTYPEDIDKEATPYKMPKGSGGALTAEERGQATLADLQTRYDELAARRKGRRKRA